MLLYGHFLIRMVIQIVLEDIIICVWNIIGLIEAYLVNFL